MLLIRRGKGGFIVILLLFSKITFFSRQRISINVTSKHGEIDLRRRIVGMVYIAILINDICGHERAIYTTECVGDTASEC